MDFETGDVVRLLSGGPWMTVVGRAKPALLGRQSIRCVWFDRAKKLDALFDVKSLEVSRDPNLN